MSETDDDLAQARAWLAMDPKEHANRMAEMAKRSAQRKEAIAYADANSTTEPVCLLTFCSKCDDSINDYNRSPIYGVCTVCLRGSVMVPAPVVSYGWKYWLACFAAGIALGAGAWFLPRLIGWLIYSLAGG